MAHHEKTIPQTTKAVLDEFESIPGVNDYVVFNYDGIPMRYNEKTMTHERAVHYAALISDYVQVTRKILKEMKEEGGPQNIRMRTKKGTEFIITSDEDFTMCCVQDCTGTNTIIIDEDENEDSED